MVKKVVMPAIASVRRSIWTGFTGFFKIHRIAELITVNPGNPVNPVQNKTRSLSTPGLFQPQGVPQLLRADPFFVLLRNYHDDALTCPGNSLALCAFRLRLECRKG